MSEPACLVRSFSHPSDASREAKEGDPIRCLTESISFGRFMSESLAWEKWSTFSHNRYLEEVEKFSKPGSVAQKKAYFEAHYKRRAAMKAATLLEETNAVVNDEPTLATPNEIQNDSPGDAESAKADSCVAIYEQQEKDIPNTVVAYSAAGNKSNSIGEGDDLENNEVASYPVVERDNMEIRELERVEAVIEQNVNVESPMWVEKSKQLENADNQNKNVAVPEENMPKKEASNTENLASSSKKRQVNSSSKSSTHNGAFRLPFFPAKRSTSEKSRNETNVAPNSKKSEGDSNNKKRSISKSLHMSINFGSHAGETRTSLILPKDSSTSRLTQTRVSVNGISKHPSKFLQSEDKRAKTPLNKSVSGGITADGKCRTLSVDHSKSSSARGSKAQSPSKSSPFSLRSDERAAKRREFFKKLEEKTNAKEAEKVQLQTRLKEKSEHDLKKLRASTGFKSEDMNRGSQSPSNIIKKIPLTRPRSPKLGRKPTSITVQDASSRPPRRPSVNTESFKHVIQKNNQSTTRSVTSLPKKKAYENASPNIQR